MEFIKHDINELVSKLDINELNINILNKVFNSFINEIRSIDKLLNFEEKDEFIINIRFIHDNKLWIGTIDKQLPNNYAHSDEWTFINLKLPNDGFFYMQTYKSDYTDLNTESIEVKTFIINIMRKLNIDDKYDETIINYKLQEQRYEIYFYDNTNKRCITLKFEYRTYEHFVNKHKYSYKELIKLTE